MTGRGRRSLGALGIVIAVIVVIGAIGCGGEDEPSTQVEGTVVSTTVADQAVTTTEVTFPLGRFENTDSGLRTMELDETGLYILRTESGRRSGRFEVDGDVFTFLENLGEESGTYNWSYEDEVLKFEVIEDASRNRYAFVTYPWVLAG